MLPNARPSRSFLTFTLVLSIASSYLNTLANSLIVDDWDRTSVQWDGAWMGFLDQPAPTWDGTLTWGNLSGSTVTFTFTGTSVQVFGAFKPVGTWSMQSQYAIDGGEPTTFLPPQAVQVEAYNQAFYDSGTLPAGEHTLKITNLGVELWLDYFLVDDDGGDSGGASSGIARDRASTTTTTTTTTMSSPAKTTTPSSSTRTTHKGTSSSTINDAAIATASTSSTSKLSTPSPLNASVSNINASLISTAPPSATVTLPSSPGPLPPSSSSTSSSNVATTTPPPGPVASQAHATGMSRKALIGLIAGIAAFAVLTILLVFWCWCRRRRQSRVGLGGVPYPFSSSTPSGQDMLLHPDPSTDAASTRSFRDSQYSATLGTGPRLSRPASSLTDLVESYAERSRMTVTHRRSMDGGVTLAGGPGVHGGGDAPSISEAQSIKSRLPPVYQAYGAA